MLYRAFVAGWGAVEGEELKRRRRYEGDRTGKGGSRPAADAYDDHVKNVPPMWGDPTGVSEPGNRRALHPAYVLILDLMRKYRNNCQDQLSVIFGVDQAAVCRHVRVADRILATMLPTPHRFMDILRRVGSKGAFDALFPSGAAAGAVLADGTHARFDAKVPRRVAVDPVAVLADGTHARFDRAGDKSVRDIMYSGKKWAYTGNTVLMTMPDGMVIAISHTLQGSAHDATITRELVGDLGAFAEGVLGAGPPKGARRT